MEEGRGGRMDGWMGRDEMGMGWDKNEQPSATPLGGKATHFSSRRNASQRQGQLFPGNETTQTRCKAGEMQLSHHSISAVHTVCLLPRCLRLLSTHFQLGEASYTGCAVES